LHNNAAELGARVQARARDVSFQTRSEKGTKIKDTFMTINSTLSDSLARHLRPSGV
jgi:hypothetical protein